MSGLRSANEPTGGNVSAATEEPTFPLLPKRWVVFAGGRSGARALMLLGMVLALDTADLGTVGSVAGELERSLRLSNTQIGLLAATPAICAAIATVPMGILADRVSRVRLLWITMIIWGATEALSGLAQSFTGLLVIRIGLGVATATVVPAVASLVGDMYAAERRGRIWGMILSGELIGSAFGYLVAGEAASFGAGSWRLAFWTLAIPSVAGAWAIRRWLVEPRRGGRIDESADAALQAANPGGEAVSGPEAGDGTDRSAAERVAEQGIEPVSERILHSNPGRMSTWQAALYVLKIPTNRVLIVASALGYFYFTGVSTFGLVYFEDRYQLPHSEATLLLVALAVGGLVGVLGGGRLADRWLAQGRLNGRITVGAWSFALAAALFLPALLTSSVVLALPLMMLAGVAFGARNPPLDAARLDIMHHLLWGRAEAVRTFLRQTMTATAPIVFGLIADQLAPPTSAAANGTHGFGANANGHGLELASLILLSTLVLGGLFTFAAQRTYPRDVATAGASEAATRTRRR